MNELDQFHMTDKKGNLSGVYDYEIFRFLKQSIDMMVIGGVVYIYDGGCYRVDVGGARLKTEIRKLIYPQFVKSTTIKRIYELFLMDSDLQESPEKINQFPKHWIPFKNGFYDPIEECLMPNSPAYKCINQIPHEYLPNAKPSGSRIEKWLEFIAPDKADREMLLEFVGYCMTTDNTQQKFLILVGVGGSGKSTLIKLIESVVGTENICNISLKELNQRFSAYGLLGKLLNSCADLETDCLEDVTLMKRASGEDAIKGEPKGKDAIWFRSYAKLLFSTNELPLILNERSNAFYRRLMVLKMDRKPEKVDADFFDKLQSETDYFIMLCVQALRRMYRQGYIAESDNSIRAVQELWTDSDTVEAWLRERCELDEKAEYERNSLYKNYHLFCDTQERTALGNTTFYRALRSKGFHEHRLSSARYFVGISVKNSV